MTDDQIADLMVDAIFRARQTFPQAEDGKSQDDSFTDPADAKLFVRAILHAFDKAGLKIVEGQDA